MLHFLSINFFEQFTEKDGWHQFSFVAPGDQSKLGRVYKDICKEMSGIGANDECRVTLEKLESLITKYYSK
jgi:hypothetical protein